MKNHLTWLALMVVLALAGCNKATEPAPAESKTADKATDKTEITLSPAEQNTAAFVIQPAVMTKQAQILRADGRIALADDHTWHVGVRTDGIVIEVYVQLGDYARKGQLLARFHADEVRDTRAMYHTAQSELRRAKDVQAQAGRDLDRAKKLLELRAGSQQQVEQAQEDVARADGDVRKAQIEIDRTTDLLEDDLKVPVEEKPGDPSADLVPIFAPESGYIITKNVTPGKTIDRVIDTFIIGDLSKVWMLASIHQENLGQVHVGQAVTVTIPNDPGSHSSGRIANLGQQFNPETRLLEVRIELNNPNQRLRPEMLATAEIPIGAASPLVTVASDAIQEVNGQNVVFIKTAADKFSTHVVRVGETAEGRTPILEGVREGDSVVVHGSYILKSMLLKATLEAE